MMHQTFIAYYYSSIMSSSYYKHSPHALQVWYWHFQGCSSGHCQRTTNCEPYSYWTEGVTAQPVICRDHGPNSDAGMWSIWGDQRVSLGLVTRHEMLNLHDYGHLHTVVVIGSFMLSWQWHSPLNSVMLEMCRFQKIYFLRHWHLPMKRLKKWLSLKNSWQLPGVQQNAKSSHLGLTRMRLIEWWYEILNVPITIDVYCWAAARKYRLDCLDGLLMVLYLVILFASSHLMPLPDHLLVAGPGCSDDCTLLPAQSLALNLVFAFFFCIALMPRVTCLNGVWAFSLCYFRA